MTISEQKKSIRRDISTLKASLTAEERAMAAQRLADDILRRSDIDTSRAILAFWPMGDEIDIAPLVRALSAKGKRVYLPVICGDDLEFRLFTSEEELTPDPRLGILQPPASAPPLPREMADSGRGVVVVTPGMAFTPDGRRLGRGRGFYDRLFAKMPQARGIGVGFRCQMVDDLPTDNHDARLDAVIVA